MSAVAWLVVLDTPKTLFVTVEAVLWVEMEQPVELVCILALALGR